MHAAGVQFYHALLVGQAAQAYTVVVHIVLRSGHYQNCGVKRVPALGQVLVGPVEICKPVVGTHDDGALPGSSAGLLCAGSA